MTVRSGCQNKGHNTYGYFAQKFELDWYCGFRLKVENSIENPEKIKISLCGINVKKWLTAGLPSDVESY